MATGRRAAPGVRGHGAPAAASVLKSKARCSGAHYSGKVGGRNLQQPLSASFSARLHNLVPSSTGHPLAARPSR